MKRIQKMFNKNFDSIYKSCRKTSRAYGLKYVPIEYLEAVINILKKHKVDPGEIEATKIQNGYFNVLDQILKTCKTQAKSIGSDGVSFDFLKGCIKVVKESFNEGLK